jgi:hypothetical protein
LQSKSRIEKLNTTRGKRLETVYKKAEKEARTEFKELKFHPLFVSGISLYWGEGTRTSKHTLRLSNIDPKMIRVFIKFLTVICGVPREKVRIYLFIYPDLNAETCVDFWKKELKLKKENFNKCTTIQGRHKTKRLKYGVCTVLVSSTYLVKKMHIWLTLIPSELINTYKAGLV